MSNHILRQLLVLANHFPGKTTRKSDLKSLIKSLQIIPIEQELIRVGPQKDGGYLLPDDLDGINYCFSPGVADCSDFEDDLASRSMHIFLADRSVEGPAKLNDQFDFTKKFIASTTSLSDDLITLDQWYKTKLGPPSEDSPEAILQMDIEGSEYEVLHSVSNPLLNRYRIIVIEFHKLYQLADRFAFNWMASAINKLLQSHAVVHIHPNNNRKTLSVHGLKIPATLEITFLRRDRLKPATKKMTFPNVLDFKCVSSKPDLTLPRCWYE